MREDDAVRAGLDHLVPFPEGERPDWHDAVERADALRSRRLRRFAVVTATALASCVAVVSLAAASGQLSGFSAWLTGAPGSPAGRAEQQSFELDTREWSDFPDRPRLRRLIEATVANVRYTLYGFRTGDSVCLRLVASISEERSAISCAPLAELRASSAPALPVLVDHAIAAPDPSTQLAPTEYVAPAASATFGLTADGVRRIELQGNGHVAAVVGNNAFLAVQSHPRVGARMRTMFAVDDRGKRVGVPLAEAPFGTTARPRSEKGEPPGPKQVERHIQGSIGWISRREPRGESTAEAGLQPYHLLPGSRLFFARVLSPDPASRNRVVVSVQEDARHGRTLCVSLVIPRGGIGGGCSPEDRFFGSRTFAAGFSTAAGGDQYTVMSGLASDEVARLEVTLMSGERRAVPLTDNAFVSELPRAQFPIRIVAYDDQERIIGVLVSPADV